MYRMLRDATCRKAPQQMARSPSRTTPSTSTRCLLIRLLNVTRTSESEDGGGAVSIERTGPVHIQIFINPPQDAEEVNVLIRYDLENSQ